MSVHEAITSHTRKMHSHLEVFQELDNQREEAIEHVISLCASGQPFTVDAINRITTSINEHAKHGISPTRPYVTPSMVEQYINRTSR
ncbi:YpbS family protein [Paenibacillus radicis (ex Xue et al. 2023)]|uniref:YpbS family protein n=1 Tax=Paenibacillus radicis (ex Xue et al. 2023) TaxID=2972489 RepID=A0ABT1YBW8_9BACL|nr:YpbS family protein [Paenibacillus radicis (ex Xue et al. 2023)]MCR8630697.1 YpbS family protein [Paenibacillus radicis (ex Xue et al. 2023)]